MWRPDVQLQRIQGFINPFVIESEHFDCICIEFNEVNIPDLVLPASGAG